MENLAQPAAYAARGSKDEDPIASLDGVGFSGQGQRGEALENRRACVCRTNCRGYLDGFGGGGGAVFSVSGNAHPDDAVADGEVGYGGAERDDGAGGFSAEDFGFGGGVETGAEVGVYVVDSDVFVLNEDFAFFGGGDGEVGFILEDFGASGLFD